MLYYMYCIEMGRSEDEFLKSSIGKVIALIEIHGQVKSGTYKPQNSKKKVTTRELLNM